MPGRGLHSRFECAGGLEFEFSEDGETEEGEDDDAAYCPTDDEDCFGVGAGRRGRGRGFGGCGGGRGGGCGGRAGRGGFVVGLAGGGWIGFEARGCGGVARGRGDDLGLLSCGRVLLFCLLSLLGCWGLRGRDDDLCCRGGDYSRLGLDTGLRRLGVDIDLLTRRRLNVIGTRGGLDMVSGRGRCFDDNDARRCVKGGAVASIHFDDLGSRQGTRSNEEDSGNGENTPSQVHGLLCLLVFLL
jgi:hypothetical protein